VVETRRGGRAVVLQQPEVIGRPAVAVSPSLLTRQRRRAALYFILPMMTVLTAVAGWPLARTIYFSFTNANLDNLGAQEWVGFANFVSLAQDPEWWRAVTNTVKFAAVSVSLETVLGLVVALTLNANLKGRGIVRTAVLIPWAVPTVVSAQMWNWMYNDSTGRERRLPQARLHRSPYAWTASPSLALAAVIAVDVWKTTPFMTLLILAALQLLPQEIYEAASWTGSPRRRCSTRSRSRSSGRADGGHHLPEPGRAADLRSALCPHRQQRQTASMAVYARQQLIDFQDVGYGSAASTFLFAVIAVFTIIYITAGRVRFDTGR